MSASSYYEVRCASCNTSFPPETRRCIHCGGPLGTGLGRLLRSERPPGGAPADEDAADEEAPFQRGRSFVWVITAVIAVLLSALRSCAER